MTFQRISSSEEWKLKRGLKSKTFKINLSSTSQKKNFQFRKANPVHKTVRAIALDKEDDIGHEKNNCQEKSTEKNSNYKKTYSKYY